MKNSLKKSKPLVVFISILLLTACANRATYNEAELIRKIDSLQQNVKELSLQVVDLQKQIDEIDDNKAIAIITTTAITTTAPVTTKQTKPATKATSTPSTTASSAQQMTFVLEKFDDQVKTFTQTILELSSEIKKAVLETDEKSKLDQFYAYQEELLILDNEILEYQRAVKKEYDNKKLDQEVFSEKWKQLSLVDDALVLTEEQLNEKFGFIKKP